MDNLTQINKATADTAEAEIDKKRTDTAATELGKFKDVKALMEAYSNLEAEFTRRSQRLKELENAIKGQGAPEERTGENACAQSENDNPAPSQEQKATGVQRLSEEEQISDDVKNAVIAEYLQRASRNKGIPFITGGGYVSARRQTPSSVKEAGRLAQQFLNKKEN